MNTQLTPKQFTLMNSIIDGADIWSPELADDLRELQKIVPDYLWIGPAQMPHAKSVVARLPYFGAILTAEGKRELSAYRQSLSHLDRHHQAAMAQAERGFTASMDTVFSMLILDVAEHFPELVIIGRFSAEGYSSISAVLTETGCQTLAFLENRIRP